MSAIPEQFLKKTAQLSADITRPFPKSRKIYIEGKGPKGKTIKVPMREVSQMDTATTGNPEPNPPIYIYDTSGPYTDPALYRSGRQHRFAQRPGALAAAMD